MKIIPRIILAALLLTPLAAPSRLPLRLRELLETQKK